MLHVFASWAGMVDCEGRWWHQKSPYLLCSSGLALAGTWALRNAWGCCSFCTCLHHGLAWLTVRAVDDTKNHLTYFVRVDWHLPGRELSEMPEVAVVFGKDPARASRSVVVFHVYVIFEASISFHVLHCFHARRCIFCAFCCVSWRACGDSCVLACQGLFGGVGCGGGWGGVGWGVGWGGGCGGCCGGGLITFLFINVPASSFLTRFSLLQVTVWHAVRCFGFDMLTLVSGGVWAWGWVWGGLERSR